MSKFHLASLVAGVCALLQGCASQLSHTATVTSGTEFAATGDSVALYIDLQGMLWKLPPNGGTAIALTDALDDLRRPQLSPDGQWLAAESFATGAWDIVVLRTDGSGYRNLTHSMHDDREPAWSADSRSIVFSSDRSGNEDVWSVELADGTLKQLTTDSADDYAPAVTADTLYFVSERGGKVALYRQRENSAATQLASAPAGRMYQPRVSPDDRSIAWVQAKTRNGFPGVAVNELVLLDVQTNETRSLAAATNDIFGMAPAWLGNDRLIYTGDGNIRRLAIDAGSAETLPFAATLALRRDQYKKRTPPALATRPMDEPQPVLGIVDPVVLADDSIVFTALGDLWQLSNNDQLRQLTNDAFVERDLSVSPDGQYLLYISDRDGGMQIWQHELATGLRRRMTNNSSGPRYPTYSPDGQHIAWLQVGPIGTQDFTVRVLDVATGESRRLRSSPKLWPGRISWSADGRNITVAELHSPSGRATDGANRLVRINIDSDTATTLHLPDFRDSEGTISNRTNTNSRRSSDVASAGMAPDFGPVASYDYRQLALIIDGSLWRLPVDNDGSVAGPPELVLDELNESPAWSHDGKRLTTLTSRGLETITLGNETRTLHEPQQTWRPAGGRGSLLVHAGRMWNGIKEGYDNDVDIFITDDRIAAIVPHAEHPANMRVIDAGTQTVLPGLIDHHVHFEPHKGEWLGRSLLAFGVTTVVEPGGLPYESREHMESWLSGRRLGPRLVFAGPQLDGARRTFYFASHITSEQRLRRELERGEQLGYGLLKTYRRMKPELQALTVQLGHARGLPVTAHAAIRNIGFGGDRTEHLRGSSRTGSSAKQSNLLASYADVEAIYSAPQASVTPTLINQGGFFDFALKYGSDDADAGSEASGLENIRQYTTLYPTAYRKNLAGFTKLVSRKIDLVRTGLANAGSTLRQLDAGGVNIVAGTDAPIFPYGLALIIELQNYVDAGLSNGAALRTATSNAASAMGAGDEVGRLAASLRADLVIVDGDPLARITDLLQVEGVMLNGRYRQLDEILLAPESRQ
jgi:Tol biopolymer transport system component